MQTKSFIAGFVGAAVGVAGAILALLAIFGGGGTTQTHDAADHPVTSHHRTAHPHRARARKRSAADHPGHRSGAKGGSGGQQSGSGGGSGESEDPCEYGGCDEFADDGECYECDSGSSGSGSSGSGSGSGASTSSGPDISAPPPYATAPAPDIDSAPDGSAGPPPDPSNP